MTKTARARFIQLLRDEILEVNAADLDFGIYRVLNRRRAEIDNFLDHGLPTRIDSAVAALPGKATEDEQARIYNALTTFFARYYDSGDFLPRPRRGKAGRYVVPYDGSDTHFHWATKGSHYVKSGERFASYAYTQPDGTRVRLLVQAAHVERDNAKGAQRHYVPVALQPPAGGHPGEWRLAFEHRELGDDELAQAGGKKRRGTGVAASTATPAIDAEDHDADAAAAAQGASLQERLLTAWLAGARVPPAIDRTLLARHALRYVKGQTTDFFVHPQLGRFLRDELDQYLQSEFVNLWDLPDAALARERGKLAICRDIGRAIIDVLAALEDLQAALFEKRKFVLGASYLVMCSWLKAQGAVGAALVERAATHAPQVARWRQWLGEPGDSAADGAALLARAPHLPLDTALFDDDFRWAVLAAVPDLQAALGGVLVHGDNYAALRTLEAQWRAAVKCIYIDPPYNTGGDGFLYKDQLTQHAAWATMLDERASAGYRLLAQDGAAFASIDDNEYQRLRQVIGGVFGDDNFVTDVIWQKKYAPANDATWFSNDHDFVVVYARDKQTWAPQRLRRTEKQDRAYANPDKDARGPWKAGDYTSNKSADERPSLYYAVINPNTGRETFPSRSRVWAFSSEEHVRNLKDNRVWWGKDGKARVPAAKRFLDEVGGVVPRTIWLHEECGHNQEAIQLLRSQFGQDVSFSTPKPSRLIERCIYLANGTVTLDYFAGSGTTAHAVINLNRDDGGARKFILVEQGEYFDTVTLPRVAKVMACPDWKDGRPKDGVQHDAFQTDDPDAHWSRRTLPIVQVLRIERYEDSLDALQLPADAVQAGQSKLPGFDALLHYVAEAQDAANPVRLSTAALAHPLDYRLPTVWEGRAVEHPVDLLHTALLLLGLHPVRLRRLQRPGAAGGGPVLLAEVRPHRVGEPATAVALELLLLRDHDVDALPPAALARQMQAEHDWLADAVHAAFGHLLASYACIHHNRDLLLSGDGERGQSLDAALAQAMWSRDPAFSAAAG